MSIKLLITMRKDLARRFSEDRSVLDVAFITGAASSVRLIGAPNYSMRVSVDENEVSRFSNALQSSFTVEPDYALDTFAAPPTSRRRATR